MLQNISPLSYLHLQPHTSCSLSLSLFDIQPQPQTNHHSPHPRHTLKNHRPPAPPSGGGAMTEPRKGG
ncbi:hypothetical protein Hanom_Chr04g00340741 [Helianthus anomalus]